MSRAVEVYLETNSISDLFRHGSDHEADLRRRLKRAIRARRLRVLTSVWTVEELTGMARSEPEKYKRAIRFVFDAAGPSVIMPTSDLTAAELRRGRALQGTERFVPWAALAAYKRGSLQLDVAARIGAEVGERKDASVRAGKAMREAVWQKLGAVAPDARAGAREWAAAREVWTQTWSRDLLRLELERLGMDPGLAADYPLERVPSIVRFVAFNLARLARYAGDGRTIERGDDADTHHYTAASYADLFVTSDVRLTETCALIPHGVATSTFEGFVGTYLGLPA
jgi:predicted nucleic acid-binding protein